MNSVLAGWSYLVGVTEKKICLASAWEIFDQFSDIESDTKECTRKASGVLFSGKRKVKSMVEVSFR